MNLKEFIAIILKSKSVILAVIILTIISVFFIKIIEPSKSVIYLDVEIKRINQPNTAEFQYDQYYAIQASSMVTDIVNNWFKNQNFQNEIMREIVFNNQTGQNLNNYVVSHKLSNQNLEIKVLTSNPETTNQIAKKISGVIQSRVKNLNFEVNNDPAFRADVQQTKAQKVSKNFIILFFASLVTGLILGIFLVLVNHQLKNK